MIKQICLVFLFFLCNSCTIVPPKLYVATQKSAVEKQLLGAFFGKNSVIVKDYQSFSDVYGTVDSSIITNMYFDSLLNCSKKRFLYVDELQQYMMDGVVGETNLGTVEVVKALQECDNCDRVKEVVEFENENRYKIFKFISKIVNQKQNEVISTFVSINKENLHKKYYKENGEWRKID